MQRRREEHRNERARVEEAWVDYSDQIARSWEAHGFVVPSVRARPNEGTREFSKAANRVRCRGSRRPRHQDRFTAPGATSRMVEDILFRIFYPPREVRTPLADRWRLRLASTASEHTRGVRPAGLGVVVDTTAGDLAMLRAIAELRARHGLQVKVKEKIRRQFFGAVGVNSQTMHGKVLFVRDDGSISADSGHLELTLWPARKLSSAGNGQNVQVFETEASPVDNARAAMTEEKQGLGIDPAVSAVVIKPIATDQLRFGGFPDPEFRDGEATGLSLWFTQQQHGVVRAGDLEFRIHQEAFRGDGQQMPRAYLVTVVDAEHAALAPPLLPVDVVHEAMRAGARALAGGAGPSGAGPSGAGPSGAAGAPAAGSPPM